MDNKIHKGMLSDLDECINGLDYASNNMKFAEIEGLLVRSVTFLTEYKAFKNGKKNMFKFRQTIKECGNMLEYQYQVYDSGASEIEYQNIITSEPVNLGDKILCQELYSQNERFLIVKEKEFRHDLVILRCLEYFED